MCEREVEALRPRPADERGAAPGEREPLGRGGDAPMAANDLVLDPKPFEQLDGLPVFARGHVDVMAAGAQALDDRPKDERMRGSRAVDPDPHTPKLTARPAGLIGWGHTNTHSGEESGWLGGDFRRRP